MPAAESVPPANSASTAPMVTAAEESASTVTAELCLVASEGGAVSREGLREFPRMPPLRRHPLRAAAWLFKASVATSALLVLLALAAATPVVNLLALGYLMEMQARVGRTGKFRSAIFLLPAAGRLGGMVLGVTLWLLPIRFLAVAARDSWLISPGGTAAWLWAGALVGASALIAVHLLLAIGCGGGLSRFVRPVSNVRYLRACWQGNDYWRGAHQAIHEFVAAWRLPHLVWLGLIGYAATYVWLAVPTYLFTMLDDVTSRFQVIGCVVGGLLMTVALMGLPLLLAHVASEGSWRAIFDADTVRRLAAAAPFRWVMTTAALLACSIAPLLYLALFKNRIPPHATNWDLMLVFLMTVAPARVLVGWAYHGAVQRMRSKASSPSSPSRPSAWLWRIWQTVNGAALAIGIGWYVYFLYLAQTGGELGARAVWQFHALLLPLPF